ncbi:protein PXR1-like [Magnolia sinica]|uniref:protein PXR1-like n=1 Tax=Magnolia sinica TaxID=86752 RepID=UPI0026589B49|nr:protein PXR1-like [Magnolia sinica]
MEASSKSTKKASRNDRMGAADSDSEKKESYRKYMERRKFKRSDSQERALDNEAAYDSKVDERKEVKRRRKEDKKLRKEERRRKREQRHRRREERRVKKLKAKSIDTVISPSDFKNNQNDACDSDGDVAEKKDFS